MINFEQLKPTSQGVVGVGIAVGYFSSKGYIVSIPLSDNQKYDLLVDIDDEIKKVQVKTTGYKITKTSAYTVQLKTVCPKKTSKNVVTAFDNTKVDYLFIVTENGEWYNIPAKDVNVKNSLSLSQKWDRYKVNGSVA